MSRITVNLEQHEDADLGQHATWQRLSKAMLGGRIIADWIEANKADLAQHIARSRAVMRKQKRRL